MNAKAIGPKCEKPWKNQGCTSTGFRKLTQRKGTELLRVSPVFLKSLKGALKWFAESGL
jgi:hypothetical protein